MCKGDKVGRGRAHEVQPSYLVILERQIAISAISGGRDASGGTVHTPWGARSTTIIFRDFDLSPENNDGVAGLRTQQSQKGARWLLIDRPFMGRI